MISKTHNKNILILYTILGLSLITSIIPNGTLSLISLALFTVSLIMAYILRRKSTPKTLTHNHAQHIIKTIWISSLIGLIFIIIGGIYMYLTVNNDPLMPCMSRFVDLAPTFNPDDFNNAILLDIFGQCIPPYMETNKTTLIITIAIMIGPMLGYFLWNYGRGLKSLLQEKACG